MNAEKAQVEALAAVVRAMCASLPADTAAATVDALRSDLAVNRADLPPKADAAMAAELARLLEALRR